MPMNPVTLSAAIKAQLLTDGNAVDNESMQALCDGIATAVVAHIIANAVVTVAPGIPVTLTPAPATAGPGTGVVT